LRFKSNLLCVKDFSLALNALMETETNKIND
jgi:hypothetical protein